MQKPQNYDAIIEKGILAKVAKQTTVFWYKRTKQTPLKVKNRILQYG